MINLAKTQDTSYLAWPKEMLYDDRNRFSGFTMPRINGVVLSDTSDLSWKKKIILARELSKAVCKFHKMGHITAGDFKLSNVMYDDSNGNLTLIDCDSFQIRKNDKTAFPSGVKGDAEYVAPEKQKESKGLLCVYTKESDYFSLAIIIYQLLSSGFHPFHSKYLGEDEDEEANYSRTKNISNGICPIFPETCKDPVTGESLPVGIIKHFPLYPDEVFSPQICELFRKTFIDGYANPKKRATAEEWSNALNDLQNNLEKCKINEKEHRYYKNLEKCPFCLIEERQKDNNRQYIRPTSTSGKKSLEDRYRIQKFRIQQLKQKIGSLKKENKQFDTKTNEKGKVNNGKKESEQIDSVQKENEKLINENTRLQSEKQRLENENKNLQSQNQQLTRTNSYQLAENSRLKKENTNLKQQLDNRPSHDLPLMKIGAILAIAIFFYLVILPAVTNPDVPLIQFGDGSGSATQTPTVSPTEAVILGAFTVTDGQNPAMSASLADGQTGVVYSNTLSFPYGSPYYVLSITDVIPPVTITASSMVPENTRASLELSLKDSDGNTVDTIQLGSSDTKRSKKITIREAGNYILIMDGKYVESVVITIEKT